MTPFMTSRPARLVAIAAGLFASLVGFVELVTGKGILDGAVLTALGIAIVVWHAIGYRQAPLKPRFVNRN